jgi:hypothetical protein
MLTGAERRSKDVEFPDALDQLDGVLAEIPSIPDNDLEEESSESSDRSEVPKAVHGSVEAEGVRG